jgi:fatty-acyl-CoA synthase
MFTLAKQLSARAATSGRSEAFVDCSTRATWVDLHEQSRGFARALLARGIRRGDHVGLMVGNSVSWLHAFFGAAMIGAITVPINTRFKTTEIEYCLKQSDVALLIYDGSLFGIDFNDLLRQVEPAITSGLPGKILPRLTQAVMLGDGDCPAGAIAFALFVQGGATVSSKVLDAAIAAVEDGDLLLIQYTSGTTSVPKGAMLTHANMVRNAMAVSGRLNMRSDDRYFSIRPFFHVSGSTLSILVSVVSGCCLLTLPKFNAAAVLDVLDRERCTMISGNDTIYLMLLSDPSFDPARIHIRGGLASAGREVMDRIKEDLRVDTLLNAYGLSEAAPNVLLSEPSDSFEIRAEGWGTTHAGIEVRIANELGAVAEPGTGEIQVKGWNVMRGYYGKPGETAATFTADGWLKTGDLGEADGHARYRMIGRLKDLYRVGGENVAPAEVEEILFQHKAVRLAQVVGVPDKRLGEVTAAFVSAKEGMVLTEADIIEWCRARCANFKVPRYVSVVDNFDAIGMTASSKIQKNKLRDYAIELWGLK